MSKPVIAVDFGGVLSVHDKHANTGAQHKNTTIDMPGAMDALRHLSQKFDLVLVSFAGKARSQETKQSILDSAAASLFSQLIFVKDKAFKADVCAGIGAVFLIDDRQDITQSLRSTTCQGILFGGHEFPGWAEVVRYIDANAHRLHPLPTTTLKPSQIYQL